MTDVRVAVFSDVHGNVPALKAVLDDIRRTGSFDEVIAAGDYCLKGPDPVRAFELVRESVDRMLVGNTDRDIHDDGQSLSEISSRKRAALDWARDQMSAGLIEDLGDLDFEALIEAPDGSALHVVHANPQDLTTHILPSLPDDETNDLVSDSPGTMIVFGHLHIPYCREINGCQLFDIAACGLPQDGDRRATWGEFTWDARTGWQGMIHRIDYDFGETVLQILDSDMPHRKKRIRDLLSASYE